jgi:hypothetical protein
MSRCNPLIAAAATAGALALGSGLASAAIVQGGRITACLDRTGAPRIIDPAKTKCGRAERALAWNQTGVPGPQGPAGAPGVVGPQGPAGVAPRVYKRTLDQYIPEHQGRVVTVNCDPGDAVVGGGWRGEHNEAFVNRSEPFGAGTWGVELRLTGNYGMTVFVHAMCLDTA